MSKWKVLIVLASFVLVADQVTKFLAVEHLTTAMVGASSLGDKVHAYVSVRHPGRTAGVTITSFWNHFYAENPGAAFSILRDLPDNLRTPFFYLISIAAVFFIVSYYRKLSIGQRYLQIALALVMGGALGNALDRVLHGYVVDFIDWHAGRYSWPTFNVADSGISVGLVMLFAEMLFVKKPAPAAKKA